LAVAPVGGCATDKRYCSAGGVLTSKCSVCGNPVDAVKVLVERHAEKGMRAHVLPKGKVKEVA